MKPDEGALARRYARAAMLYCDAHGGHDAFGAGLEKLGDAFLSVPVFQTLLVTPILRKDKKTKLVTAVSQSMGLPASVASFVGLLVARSRVEYLGAIARKFQQLLDEKNQRLRAEVYTAVALDDLMKQRISKGLSTRFDKEVICAFHVDEGLYGGVLARVGNTVVDSSIRGKLDTIRQRISALTS
jgi:F-type H+-transporting ATPase subunit delta